MNGWRNNASSTQGSSRLQSNSSAGYSDARLRGGDGSSSGGGGDVVDRREPQTSMVSSTGVSPTAANRSNLVFCVSSTLFEHCGLLLDSPSGLTTTAITRLRQEAATTTAISLTSWKDLAVNALGLRESVAYSIFDVFYALSGGFLQNSPSTYGSSFGNRTLQECRLELNRALLSKMGDSFRESEWPSVSASRFVSLPGLLVFLLAQALLDRPPHCALGETPQDTVMSNVKQMLHDFISVVAISRPGRITMADMQELRLLLREFVNGVEQPFGTNLGFLFPRNEKTIDIAVLAQFIRPRITLPSDLSAQFESQGIFPFSNNLVMQNLQDAVYIPPSPLFSTEPLTKSTSKSVVTQPNAKLPSASVVITQCSQSSIYVASDLPNTRIAMLANCTVALGPVGGVLCVDRCHNCNITALCSSVVVSNCKNVNLFLCTNTPPVISLHGDPQSIDKVRFGPYNSYYSTLEEHLAATGVNPKLNLWNTGLPSAKFLLPPEEFTSLCFPIAPQAMAVINTRANPCTLPWVYAEALQNRVDKFQKTSQQLQEAYQRLEKEDRKDLAENLRAKIHVMFMEWVQKTGQAKGLVDLLHAQQTSGGAGSGSTTSGSGDVGSNGSGRSGGGGNGSGGAGAGGSSGLASSSRVMFSGRNSR